MERAVKKVHKRRKSAAEAKKKKAKKTKHERASKRKAAASKRAAEAKKKKAKKSSCRVRPGYYEIQTSGVHAGRSARQPTGWGLSAWHGHGAKRNGASSRVAVHNGNYWLMDWYICPSKRTKGTYTIKTSGVHSKTSAKQPAGWGLAAWQLHGGKRNSGSSWVYVHSGNRWLMDWRLIRKAPHKRAARERKTKSVRKEKAVKAAKKTKHERANKRKAAASKRAAEAKKKAKKMKHE